MGVLQCGPDESLEREALGVLANNHERPSNFADTTAVKNRTIRVDVYTVWSHCNSRGVLRRLFTESFEANIPTGKQLIDAIFSHQALSYEDGRDLSYMRQVAGKTCV